MRESDYLEFVEPIDVHDTYVDGIARVEGLNCSLARVWLYSTEGLSEPLKVIRARLVLPLEVALEMNAEAESAFRAIHRSCNPLRLVR